MHAETGQAPIERFEAGGPPRQADPDLLREAFRWSVTRKVTRTATVPLEGNAYAVDPALAGRRVELRYDPEDLTRIDVLPRRQARRDRHPVRHPPPRAPGRPPGRPARAGPDRDRLPRPGRRRPRREAAGTGAKIDFAQLGHVHRRRRQARTSEERVSPAPWAAHFGLARTPFGKSIAAKDLFARQAHAEAVARISFCVVESALGVVTGDVGAGKTVALRAAVAALDPTRHQVIYIANPAFGTRGLYVTIVRALGAQPRYLKAELMAQAADLLAAETAERHRRVVLIFDEAHLLQPDQLEELRLLTNAEMDSASPFAGILAGQPTLNRQLRMGIFAALDQRIATRFTIKPMDLAESAAYLRHHLALAGREDPLFADDADRPAAPRRQRPAPRAQQRRHRRAHRRRRRRQGPRRRRLRQESRRRAHPRLSRATARPARPPVTNPAVAARVRQLAAQAEHRRAIAEFRARHAADQQARINALLLEAIAALASLLSAAPGPPPPSRPARPAAARTSSPRPAEREHRTLPNHVQTSWPLTHGPGRTTVR